MGVEEWLHGRCQTMMACRENMTQQESKERLVALREASLGADHMSCSLVAKTPERPRTISRL